MIRMARPQTGGPGHVQRIAAEEIIAGGVQAAEILLGLGRVLAIVIYPLLAIKYMIKLVSLTF